MKFLLENELRYKKRVQLQEEKDKQKKLNLVRIDLRYFQIHTRYNYRFNGPSTKLHRK